MPTPTLRTRCLIRTSMDAFFRSSGFKQRVNRVAAWLVCFRSQFFSPLSSLLLNHFLILSSLHPNPEKMEQHIQHFSHRHLLKLTSPWDQSLIPCSACKLRSSGSWMCTCKTCPDFTLHVSCTQMHQLITHPLSLLPKPIYPGGLFRCDCCGNPG